MEKLSNPQVTIETIRRYDFAFQKRYGQNFLIDERVLGKIMDAAGVTEDDAVLEIGPGIGTLTQYLAERARTVIAVEIDRNLIPILQETLSEYDNVVLIEGDILKTDIAALVNRYNGGQPVKVVANLPYYITTPIIMGLFEGQTPVDNITVMVQKEVALRMQATPGSKDYGALSLAVQYYAEPYLAANVPPNCFIPRPNVGSAVIRLTRWKEPPVQTESVPYLFSVIHAAFQQRRKTLANSLVNAGCAADKEQVAGALREMHLPETVRGEALTLPEFAHLSDLLYAKQA